MALSLFSWKRSINMEEECKSPMKGNHTASKNDEDNDKALSKLTKKVQKAVKGKLQGDSQPFTDLLSSVRTEQDPNTLCLWLSALSYCISSHTGKVDDWDDVFAVIEKFDLDCNLVAECADAFTNLLMNLMSANSAYIGPIISRMLMRFRRTKQVIEEDENGEQIEQIVPDLSGYSLSHIHKLFRQILFLSPTSYSILQNRIESKFPHVSADVEEHRAYIYNILDIASYVSAIRHRIIEIAIENMLKIDVEIKLEDLPDDDGVFQFEEEDQVVIVEVDGRVERVDMMAEKLDAMMELMFSFIDQVNTGDEEDMNGLFETLMRIFEASILVTHKSKYVQFLLFYACHINKFYAETFLSRLLHKLFDASNSEIHRWSCGCYLGSFIARATCIEDQTLQTVLDLMISWLFSYLERVGDNAFPDPNVHMVFYTVFQSICYIICYKADFFRTSEHGLDFLHQFRWDRIIESALNPLKYCFDGVVREFCRVFRKLELFDCRDIIVRNARQISLSSFQVGEAFFPFDPYLLRHSCRYIQDIYQSWEHPQDGTAEPDIFESVIPETPNDPLEEVKARLESSSSFEDPDGFGRQRSGSSFGSPGFYGQYISKRL